MNDLRLAPAAAPAGAPLISETTDRAFAKDVLDASRTQPVLVDFWADWCTPCKQLTPVLEAQVRAAKGTVRLVKMNIDQNPGIAGQLGIQSIPAVVAFSGGRPVDWFQGNIPESQVKAFIAKIAGPPPPTSTDELVTAGYAALTDEAFLEASEMFAAVLGAEPENLRAITGLARAAVGLGELDRASEVMAVVPAAKAADPDVVAVRALLALAQQTAAIGNPAELKERIARDGNDLEARFDLALIENARGDRTAAVGYLLDIMRKDRSWNEDKARKQLVQFFEAWGAKDEATIAGRRRLSSLLFS